MASTRRSLIIGVNGYKPDIGRLNYCASDARRIEGVLNAHRDGFNSTESILLADELLGGSSDPQSPTRSNIIENIVSLCERAVSEDTLLIYFSGHGTLGKNNRFYLLPLDARSASIEQTAISWQWLKDTVDQSQAKNKIVIIDACHSGAGKDVTASVRTSFKIMEEVEQDSKGFVCLTSCSGGQVSYELAELEQGIFSHYLISGINGAADPLGRGVVDIESLYTFVRDRTKLHAKQIGAEQDPHLISHVSAPLNTFIISAAPLERPINRVLVLTEDPLLGHMLEIGIRRVPLARDAIWSNDIEKTFSEVRLRLDYDAIYIDIESNWNRKKDFILMVRQKYPIVPFVLVGSYALFSKQLDQENRRRFLGYFFFDIDEPISRAATQILDTLAQVEWDIRVRYGEGTSEF